MIGSRLRGWFVRPLRLLVGAPLRSRRRILPLLGTGVLVLGLAGCGNGLKVAGPADTPTPSVVSGSPTATATATPSRPSPAASSTDADHHPSAPADTAAPPGHKDSGGGRDDSGSDGSGDNGSDKGDNGSGSGSGGPTGRVSDPDTNNEPGSVGSATSTASDPQRTCHLADLEVGVRSPEGGGAAGSQYVLITFANTSDSQCWMYGYAGVSLVGFQDGTRLGRPASRDHSTKPNRIKLSVGDKKTELLQIADAGNWDPEKCVPTTADGFRIYPPASYTAAYVPFKIAACQSKKVSQLTVYPVGAKA